MASINNILNLGGRDGFLCFLFLVCLGSCIVILSAKMFSILFFFVPQYVAKMKRKHLQHLIVLCFIAINIVNLVILLRGLLGLFTTIPSLLFSILTLFFLVNVHEILKRAEQYSVFRISIWLISFINYGIFIYFLIRSISIDILSFQLFLIFILGSAPITFSGIIFYLEEK